MKLMVNKTQQGQAQSGFTLVEIMITVLVLAVVLNFGVPAMGAFVERNRLKSAAEDVYSKLNYARSESIKQSRQLVMHFSANGTDTWSFGIGSSSGCDLSLTDPTAAGACAIDVDASAAGTTMVLKVTKNKSGDADYQNIKMDLTNASNTSINPTYNISFDQVRGTATAGKIVLTSESGWIIRNEISPLGHVKVCSPAGNNKISGYPECAS